MGVYTYKYEDTMGMYSKSINGFKSAENIGEATEKIMGEFKTSVMVSYKFVPGSIREIQFEELDKLYSENLMMFNRGRIF